ncbi:ComEC/Rec2 family competence protein [Candidatus Omnitrophota bacterium]
MAKDIKSDDLVVHFLNVGFGDTIIIEFPADASGNRRYGLIDCYSGKKTISYLDKLMQNIPAAQKKMAFICATHPHYDHIAGIRSVMKSVYCPLEFWDSGFRHNSQTYKNILDEVFTKNIRMVRVSSGMEWYFGCVRITALSPAVSLRNRFATYGVDMNNASIVLRIEHTKQDAIIMQSKEYKGDVSQEATREAGKSVMILGGDAEFDSWTYVSQEYPKVERNSSHNPLVKKMINYLSASVIKVAHHGSMHSAPLDLYEKITPGLAIISTKQQKSSKKLVLGNITRDLFPHQSAVLALEESNTKILTTDGSYESQAFGNNVKDNTNNHPGSIVVVVPPGGIPRSIKLSDTEDIIPDPPKVV